MDRVCPFMSRPVVTNGWAIQEAEVTCLHERCAAWHQFRDPDLPGYCLLIGRRG